MVGRNPPGQVGDDKATDHHPSPRMPVEHIREPLQVLAVLVVDLPHDFELHELNTVRA
jgi:hypothetical protein